MGKELLEALEQIGKGRGISQEVVIKAVEAAVLSAYRKSFGSSQNVRVNLDFSTGEVGIFVKKKVVEEVKDETKEISEEDAKKINPQASIGDRIEVELDPEVCGRIAAQTAKQMILQRLREAQMDAIYEEFEGKEGKLISGMVERIEGKDIIVNVGRAEAILPYKEQIPREIFKRGDRITAYILKVERTRSGVEIRLSRRRPAFLEMLFRREIPEIANGIVEIKKIARDPGRRTKIAVYSKDPNVDPIGACVGMKGTRIQAIVKELKTEKIDVVPWSSDPERYVMNSLVPSRPVKVLLDHSKKRAIVVVPDDQFSLAVGKNGQNTRLASLLTGWKIDVRKQSEWEEEEMRNEELMRSELMRVEGIGEKTVERLIRAGYKDINSIMAASAEELAAVPGIGHKLAAKIKEKVKGLAGSEGRGEKA